MKKRIFRYQSRMFEDGRLILDSEDYALARKGTTIRVSPDGMVRSWSWLTDEWCVEVPPEFRLMKGRRDEARTYHLGGTHIGSDLKGIIWFANSDDQRVRLISHDTHPKPTSLAEFLANRPR